MPKLNYVPPFYAWECLTIVLPNREIDLVIQNEQQMTNLLKFLVYEMRTVDGNKNSADKICKRLYKEAFFIFQKQKSIDQIGEKD